MFAMRLDLFLKVSRLCLRRSVAQQLCDAGAVLLNNSPAKSAHQVKAGDEITLRRRDKLTTVRVMKVPGTKQVSKSDSSTLFELISETIVE
jgi:ribosomal 50S subunit-recycling heat shock protein